MTGLEILRPVGDVFVPFSQGAATTTILSQTNHGDSTNCVFGSVKVEYYINTLFVGESVDRQNNFPLAVTLTPGQYRLVAVAVVPETGQAANAETVFNVANIQVGPNGYPYRPFEALRPEASIFENTVFNSM